MERPESDPRELLAARGIPIDEDRLFRAAQSGDREAVRLLLAAGVRANARTASGDAAVVVAARNARYDVVSDLLAAGADPQELAHALSDRGRRKDLWEKLGSLSAILTFTSSVMIAGIGWYFTKSYNDRQVEALRSQNLQQNRLVEMQTIERLIPHLTKDEESKRAALIAIKELASPALAIQIGEAFGGTGAVAALGSIASQGGPSAGQAVSGLATIASRGTAEESAAVQSVLGKVFADARDSVVTVVVDGRRCSGFVVSGTTATTVLTADYCVPRDAKSVAIELLGRRVPASIMSAATSSGVVAIRATDLKIPGLRLAADAPELGTQVIAIAAPMMLGDRNTAKAFPGRTTAFDVDLSPSVTAGLEEFGVRGRVNGLLEVTFDRAGDRGGSGGGPILDPNGSVACMVYLGSETTDFCVPAAGLRAAITSR